MCIISEKVGKISIIRKGGFHVFVLHFKYLQLQERPFKNIRVTHHRYWQPIDHTPPFEILRFFPDPSQFIRAGHAKWPPPDALAYHTAF